MQVWLEKFHTSHTGQQGTFLGRKYQDDNVSAFLYRLLVCLWRQSLLECQDNKSRQLKHWNAMLRGEYQCVAGKQSGRNFFEVPPPFVGLGQPERVVLNHIWPLIKTSFQATSLHLM